MSPDTPWSLPHAYPATTWVVLALIVLFLLSLVAGLALGDIFETRHFGSGL